MFTWEVNIIYSCKYTYEKNQSNCLINVESPLVLDVAIVYAFFRHAGQVGPWSNLPRNSLASNNFIPACHQFTFIPRCVSDNCCSPHYLHFLVYLRRCIVVCLYAVTPPPHSGKICSVKFSLTWPSNSWLLVRLWNSVGWASASYLQTDSAWSKFLLKQVGMLWQFVCVCVRAPACVCNSSYHALIIYTIDVHVVCYEVRALRCLQCHKVRLNGTNSLHWYTSKHISHT